MNPRAAINDLLPFQGSPFSQLGLLLHICLNVFFYSVHKKIWLKTERVGFEPTRPFGTKPVFKTASL